MSTTVKSMFTDIGFEWGLQKYAAVEVKRRKLTEGGNLTIEISAKSVQSTLSHLITTSVSLAMFTHFLVEHGLSQYYLY